MGGGSATSRERDSGDESQYSRAPVTRLYCPNSPAALTTKLVGLEPQDNFVDGIP
jgi:hypothetical protein